MNSRFVNGEGVENLRLAASAGASESAETSAAFEAVFLEHHARVVGIIARVVADRARAEQLASDVFWKLYRRPSRVEDAAVGAWLCRAALHTALDALRVAGRRARHEGAAAVETQQSHGADDPLDALILAERRQRVRATLAQLKRRDARLLLLRASGLSYQEIAATLRLNPRSVGKLLSRAEESFERHHRASHGGED